MRKPKFPFQLPDKPQRSGFVEEQINEAILRGDFDNVKGKGEPLPQRPDLAKADAMRQKLRHDAGFAPPWEDLAREIETQTQRVRGEIVRALEFRRAGLRSPRADPKRIEADFAAQLENIESLVAGVNSLILKNNLLIPPTLPQLHRRRLKLDELIGEMDGL